MAENKYRRQVVKIYQHIIAKNPSKGITVALIQRAPETLKTVIFNIYGETVYYMPGALLEGCCHNLTALPLQWEGWGDAAGREGRKSNRETGRVGAGTFFFQSPPVQCETIYFTL